MKNIKLFILLLALGSVPGYLTAEDEASAEEESKAAVPSNPQELLEVVKRGQFADTQEQRDREARSETKKISRLKCFLMQKPKEQD